MIKEITKSKIQSYRHVYGLNGYCLPVEKKQFFKYMPMNRFIDNVSRNEFVIVSPVLWNDPFESIYFNIDCSSHKFYPDELFCLCVTDKSSLNSEAAWNMYLDGEKGVRLSLEYDILLHMLGDYANVFNCEVYLGNAIYDYDAKTIETIYKQTSTKNIFCPSDMHVEHYLSLLLLKRKAFAYENETRIFLVRNDFKWNNYSKNICRIPCDYSKLVSRILLSPLKSNGSSISNVMAIEKLNSMISSAMKDFFKELLPNCDVQQSHLYESEKRIKKLPNL